VDPYEDAAGFDKALKKVSTEIKRLSHDSRRTWFTARPKAKIKNLKTESKNAITNVYSVMARTEVDEAALNTSIAAAVTAFYKGGSSDALALGSGVGGHIVDNRIDGRLLLNYAGKFTPLLWPKGNEHAAEGKEKFLKQDYIDAVPVTLALRGNNVYAVLSNGAAICKVLKAVVTGKPWDENISVAGYDALTVTGNVFGSNGSGFIGEWIVMTDNIFKGKATSDQDAAAFALGYSGVFTGNAGVLRELNIYTMLKPRNLAKSANLVGVIT
jgi:hypothetical protein